MLNSSKYGWQNMNKIAKYLNEHIHGSAFSTPRILDAYSTDRSVIKIKPDVVVLPNNVEDVRRVLRFADQLTARKIPVSVTVRGSGLDKTGACLGSSIVLSMERMNKVSEIDVRQRLVRCQAGATLGDINSALALHGLTLPIHADPNETIGGIIASAGHYDVTKKSPSIHRCLEKAEFVLPSGDCFQTETFKKKALNHIVGQSNASSRFYRNLVNLLSDHSSTIEDLLDPIAISPVGYSSIARLSRPDGSLDVTPLLFGSQGTLAVVTEVILRCVFLPAPPDYIFAQFPDIDTTIEFAEQATTIDPTTLDIYDLNIINKVSASGKTLRPFATDSLEEGFLAAVSLSDFKPRKRRSKLRTLTNIAKNATNFVISDDSNYEDFTELHSLFLAYFNDANKTARLPLVDGALIPEDNLYAYIKGLKSLEEKHSCELSLFGSYLSSTYSVRPEINLSSVTGRQFILSFLRDYHDLLKDIDGYIVGDAPEGRIKGLVTEPSFDPKVAELFADIKKIFDPRGILNPGVKIDVNLRSTIRGLRTSYDTGIIT